MLTRMLKKSFAAHGAAPRRQMGHALRKTFSASSYPWRFCSAIRHGGFGQSGGDGRQKVAGVTEGGAAGFGQGACLLEGREDAPRFGVGLFGAAQGVAVLCA